MEDPFYGFADSYLSKVGTLRAVVCHSLVARQPSAHLPQPPARIAYIGGGAGHQAIPLVREGYEVTRRRVRMVEGAGERAREILGGFPFDAVLCHGLLQYLEDSHPLIQSLASVARPGAVISALAKNTNAMAVRPALEGRYEDALAVLDADRALGRLGAVTRGDTVAGLHGLFEKAGAEPVRWYGFGYSPRISATARPTLACRTSCGWRRRPVGETLTGPWHA